MGRSPKGQARRWRRPDRIASCDTADEDLGEFLQRVDKVEVDDPDEPGRWAAFFARLQGLLERSGSHEE